MESILNIEKIKNITQKITLYQTESQNDYLKINELFDKINDGYISTNQEKLKEIKNINQKDNQIINDNFKGYITIYNKTIDKYKKIANLNTQNIKESLW